ncbi:hypothetical protein M0R45_025402 [Rubus argutus]|uniref:Uncharacterized protein n=1 Tax=Rubus argutus TaxID=59490 RepID=A0AAW1WX01_RUBAR
MGSQSRSSTVNHRHSPLFCPDSISLPSLTTSHHHLGFSLLIPPSPAQTAVPLCPSRSLSTKTHGRDCPIAQPASALPSHHAGVACFTTGAQCRRDLLSARRRRDLLSALGVDQFPAHDPRLLNPLHPRNRSAQPAAVHRSKTAADMPCRRRSQACFRQSPSLQSNLAFSPHSAAALSQTLLCCV